MKAAVFKELGQPLAIEDVAIQQLAPEEVLVGIALCRICGNYLHMTEDPVFGFHQATVLGHEYASEVIEAGSRSVGLKIERMPDTFEALRQRTTHCKVLVKPGEE